MGYLATAIVSFFYLRIGSVLLFDKSMSVAACAFTALLTALVLFAVDLFSAGRVPLKIAKFVDANQGKKAPDVDTLMVAIFGIPALLGMAGAVGAMWLMSIGFSEDFYEDVLLDPFASYYRTEWGEFLVVTVFGALPGLPYFMLQAWRARGTAKELLKP